MNKYYVAYGSNLNKKQMKKRCPDAKFLGTGTIKDYELLFRGGLNAVATIEPKKGGTVDYGLWEISPADEQKLDRYEGFPNLYRKEQMTLCFEERNIEAMAYIMDPDYVLGIPPQTYYSTIFQGYLDCGFDTERLLEAAQKCADEFNEMCAKKGMQMGRY